ncbi:MAG: phospho-sugar mutase [Christensenellales bacterium]|jgi:phosphoglucomutase
MRPEQEYQAWLAMCKDDPALYADLIAIKDDPKEIRDRFYAPLSFGTAGMRGVLGAGLNRMNAPNVRLATAAFAKALLESEDFAARGVAIAYDSRRMSQEFALQAALTLCAKGVKAFLFTSLRPVPVLSFTIRHLRAAAGIVITASHNPPQYNGYKVYWEDGGQMPPDRAKVITDIRDTLTYQDALSMDEKEALEKGLLVWIGQEVDDAYIASIKKLCVNPDLAREMGKTLKIVYTPLFGSGNVPVRRILSEIGFENVAVVKEQEMPNGDFPNLAAPNPEDPAALALGLKLQEEIGADIVFGTDPDCDRVGVAVKDREGNVHTMTGNQIGCLLLHYILEQKKEKGTLPKNAAAVKSIVSTNMAQAICDDFGVKLFDVLTGFKYIAEKIQQFEDTGEYTFVFGFEESNGFLSGTDVRDKDGVNACMLIAELAALCKKQHITLYDRLQSLYAKYGYYGESVTSVSLTGVDGLQKQKSMMASLRRNPPAVLGGKAVTKVRDYQNGYDGLPASDVLYYEMEGGAWVCVRPSGTEPKIKLYVNAKGKDAAERDSLLSAIVTDANRMMEAL